MHFLESSLATNSVLPPTSILQISLSKIRARLATLAILARVDVLVIEKFDEVVEPGCHHSAHRRPKPIDPMVSSKARSRHARSERPSWVYRRSRVVHTRDFDDEEREANANGRDKGIFGLLGGEH
jgi:hypothetical protein